MSKRVMCGASLGVIAIASSMGCGAGYRRDFLGRSYAVVATAPDARDADVADPAGASSAPGAGTVAVHTGDELEVQWSIIQPRAERVRYAIACADVSIEPVEVGESIEEYRARRVAEIRAARDRDRRVVASVASALVPDVGAQGVVQTPNATGTVAVGVDRQVVGEAVATSVVTTDIQLPPDDLGGGTLTGTVRLSAGAEGTCAMTVYTDTPGVAGTIAVTRVVDLGRERRARDQARRDAALTARAELTASLHAAGARDRVVEVAPVPVAPVPVVAVAPVAPTVTVDVGARIERDLEVESLALRGRYMAYLVGECHANPHAREERRARDQRRIGIALQLRARLRAQLVAYGADPEYRIRMRLAEEARAAAAETARAEARARAAAHAAAIAAALEARAHAARATRVAMIDFLLGLGARLRPPMPPPVPEDPGSEPFSGATWIAGQWIWIGAEWQWQTGGWRDTSSFGVDVVVDNGPRETWTVHDNRTAGGSATATGTVTHDNRTAGGSATATGTVTHDNRTTGGPATITLHPSRDAGGGDRTGSGGWVVHDRRTSGGGERTTTRASGSAKDKDVARDRDKDKDKDKRGSRDADRAGVVVHDRRR